MSEQVLASFIEEEVEADGRLVSQLQSYYRGIIDTLLALDKSLEGCEDEEIKRLRGALTQALEMVLEEYKRYVIPRLATYGIIGINVRSLLKSKPLATR